MKLPSPLSVLKNHAVWVAWNLINGRKVPMSPFGGAAKTNDASTWGTFEQAQAAASENGYSGVGIMLGDGLVGIDLDKVISESGDITPWAQELIDEIGSYTELSPSGTGVHILAYADPKKTGAIGRTDRSKGLEIYNHGRYFTVTGNHKSGASVAVRTAEIAGVVSRYFPYKSKDDLMREAVQGLVKDQVKRRANETMRHNSKRDKRRYARVPMGGETCSFCLMLASRGFVYRSAESAGEHNHYHSDCRCKVIPGFQGMQVEGYDPDKYDQLYRSSIKRSGGAVDLRATLREMDRKLYPSIKDKRNARRRELYAEKKAAEKASVKTLGIKRVSDGTIVQTHCEDIKPTKSMFKGWCFDWVEQAKQGDTIRALYVEGDKRIQGAIAMRDKPSALSVYVSLVEAAPFNSGYRPRKRKEEKPEKEYKEIGARLFAEAVKESYRLGYNGFVTLTAKTALIRHYEKIVGAKLVYGTQEMYIDEEAAKELYKRFLS